jgi:hypothetical protein
VKPFRLIAALLLFAHLHMVAEEIELKDGTKITGKIVSVRDDSFQVKTAYGDITVPREQILTINFPENQSKSAPSAPTLSPIDESLTGTSYVNRTAGFVTTLPKGWRISPELRKSNDIAAALISGDQTLFFLVTPEKFSGTMSTYKVLAETQYKVKFSDYQKLSEAPAQVDSQPAVRLSFLGTENTNHTTLKFLVYIIPYEGRMVRLTFFTLDALYEDAVPVFEKIAASYHSTDTKK